MNFREVEKKLCIIVDEQTVKLLAPDVDCNALLCMGYVDYEAGLTYEVLAVANFCDGDYSVEWETKDVGMKIRAGATEGKIIMPIENKVLMNKFRFKIDLLETYYGDKVFLKCREIKEIDEFRHPDFPDDVLLILAKEGNKPEKIWGRIVSFVGDDGKMIRFNVRLLNEPFVDFGVHFNDTIECVSLLNSENKRLLVGLVE